MGIAGISYFLTHQRCYTSSTLLNGMRLLIPDNELCCLDLYSNLGSLVGPGPVGANCVLRFTWFGDPNFGFQESSYGAIWCKFNFMVLR